MKTKSIGSYTYFVTKYFYNENGKVDVEVERWCKPKYAFDDVERHEAKYGKNMAFVFKAKHCIEVKK